MKTNSLDHRSTGPGLAKIRGLPLIQLKHSLFAVGIDSCIREWIKKANLVSEGKILREKHGPVYYGSTHLVLGISPKKYDHLALIKEWAMRDLHFRLRITRIARQEAENRANASLGTSRCEIHVSEQNNSLSVDVDLSAPLLASSSSYVGTRL